MTPKERRWLWLGLGFVFLIGLRDIASPDLFWHLGVGRRILETGSLPLTDIYSHTKLGLPWREYEWLADLLWAGVEGRAGALGLILLKAALLAVAAACAAAALRLQGWGGRARALAVLALAAAWHLVNDVRPDNFTLPLFAAELLALEAGRLGRLGQRWALAFFAGGALWANLHPGFAYGLCLPPLYALDAALSKRGRPLLFLGWEAALLLGSFLNPLGPALLMIIAEHAQHAGDFGSRIMEWRRPGADWNCLPFWLLLAVTAVVLALRRPRSVVPWGLCLGTAVWAVASQRAIPYFALAALVALGQTLAVRPLSSKTGGLVAALLLAYFVKAPARLTSGWNLENYPVAAASFLEGHPELASLPLYNPLAWGGYLSSRLWPRYLIYMDGRSLFLDMIGPDELHKDTPPVRWQETLDRRAIGLALMYKKLPEIGGKPYWHEFMPEQKWALIYEDEVSLLFKRRQPL